MLDLLCQHGGESDPQIQWSICKYLLAGTVTAIVALGSAITYLFFRLMSEVRKREHVTDEIRKILRGD